MAFKLSNSVPRVPYVRTPETLASSEATLKGTN